MPAHVPPVADEGDALLQFLRQQRQGLRYAAHGLTDEAARAPSASTLSIGGLIKHVTSVDRYWIALVTGAPWQQHEQAYVDGFRMIEGETLASVLDDCAAAADETHKAVAAIEDLVLLAAAEGWPEDGWMKPWRRDAVVEGER